jgi:hypothetical protein
MRLEPIRKVIDRKSLDIMFIMDCTGSMGHWIDAAKREIKSIIDCLKNQFFNLKIRVSFVGYRDHSVHGGETYMYSIFKFSEDIESCLQFLSKVEAIMNSDSAEDAAGGL